MAPSKRRSAGTGPSKDEAEAAPVPAPALQTLRARLGERTAIDAKLWILVLLAFVLGYKAAETRSLLLAAQQPRAADAGGAGSSRHAPAEPESARVTITANVISQPRVGLRAPFFSSSDSGARGRCEGKISSTVFSSGAQFYLNDFGCTTGPQVRVDATDTPAPKRPTLSDSEKRFCSDHAGDGAFDANGVWTFQHAERCGHRWYTSAEACRLLDGWSIVVTGDSTSRRLAIALKSFLGGLVSAGAAGQIPTSAEQDAREPQLIPDAFSVYTDNVPRCVPETQCPNVVVAGTPYPESNAWESVAALDPAAKAKMRFVNPSPGSSAVSKSESYPVTWRAFFTPFVVPGAQVHVWAPNVKDFRLAVKMNRLFASRIEATNERAKTMYIMNFGSWHLQGSFPFVVARGAVDPFNEHGANRNKPIKSPADYLDRFRSRVASAFNYAETAQSDRTLWVWRTMAAVNESAPRFAPDTNGTAANERAPKTRQGLPYPEVPVNDLIARWNNLSSHEAHRKGWVVANVFNATRPGSPATAAFQPSFDNRGSIHLRDAGRRVSLQIVLNSVAPYV